MKFLASKNRHKEGVSFRERKRVLVLSLLGIAVLIAVLFSVRIAFADPEGETEEKGATTVDSILTEGDAAELLSISSLQNNYMARLGTLFEIKEHSTADPNTESLMYSLMEGKYGIGNIGHRVCMTIGLVLVLAFSIAQFIQILEREEEALETLVKLFLTTALGMMVVIYAYDIAKAIENIGTVLYGEIIAGLDRTMSGTAETVTGAATSLPTGWNDVVSISQSAADASATARSLVSYGAASVVLWFVMTATFYAICTSAYGLMFELVIRKIFAPIALADFISDGLRSPGAKYLKNYLGVYIRIAILGIVVFIGWWVTNWIYRNPAQVGTIHTVTGSLGSVLCIRFAMKALLNASGGIVREMLGGG